ncbi:MAG TPA: patatin-like phospholipase family protein, partial [Steroidobacteraceae bacterium]|nr:patatin-like phospholipase family protein [Steroidobacteraceae bacterium]
HDSTLREIYTSFASHDLIRRRSLLAVVTGDAAFDTAPLRRLLDRYLDDTHVAAMAAEHRRGRTLLVATTNLDAARPVIWDLTRIAASGRPEAGRLIRDVILASAAIPAAFPPVTFKVTAGGGTYDELHVDGGVTSQLFFGPPGIDWRQVAERLRVQGRPELYLIRNSRLLPRFEPVPREIGPIVTRTLASLIRTQGIGDLARVYIVADRDGLGFNLARIPPTFDATPSEPFDRDYMRQLFELGYEAGFSGNAWLRDPER